MTEEEQLREAFVRMGAPSAQAGTMARQMLKRAGQLAEARGLTRAQALAHLGEIVAKGRQGEVPKGFSPPDGGRGSG